MRCSRTVKWLANNGEYEEIPKSTSAYFPLENVIMLANSNNPRLAAIVHEINECEVHWLLVKMKKDAKIKLTAKIMQKYSWLFYGPHLGINSIIVTSHIVSPYGCCGCMMPRRKYRISW